MKGPVSTKVFSHFPCTRDPALIGLLVHEHFSEPLKDYRTKLLANQTTIHTSKTKSSIMAFDIDLIKKVYADLPGKVAEARKVLGRPSP